jgi:hypothetical protein
LRRLSQASNAAAQAPGSAGRALDNQPGGAGYARGETVIKLLTTLSKTIEEGGLADVMATANGKGVEWTTNGFSLFVLQALLLLFFDGMARANGKSVARQQLAMCDVMHDFYSYGSCHGNSQGQEHTIHMSIAYLNHTRLRLALTSRCFPTPS